MTSALSNRCYPNEHTLINGIKNSDSYITVSKHYEGLAKQALNVLACYFSEKMIDTDSIRQEVDSNLESNLKADNYLEKTIVAEVMIRILNQIASDILNK